MGEDSPQHCEKENLNQFDNTDMSKSDHFKIPELSKSNSQNLPRGYTILTILNFNGPMSLDKLKISENLPN